jgi:hypothetical protein
MDKNIENKIPKIKSLFIKYGVKRAFFLEALLKVSIQIKAMLIFYILSRTI